MTQPLPKDRTRSRSLYVHTLGCQMNEYDSLRLRRILGAEGYTSTSHMEEADVIFLNTCSVREKPEQKVYSFLGRLRRLKTRNPALKILVGGCMAQQLGRQLLDRFDTVDLVLGTRAVGYVRELLERVRETGSRLAYLPEEEAPEDPPCWTQAPAADSITALITIMQGCDNFCTYCIVPYVRGRERSRPPERIVLEAKWAVESGVREVVLLGQNVNSYGHGLSPRVSFVELLGRVQEVPGLSRIRFTTSHPKDLTESLMKAFVELPALCPHLHLPFQSGSDRVLRAMNRGYTAAQYAQKIYQLREICPEIALSADVMVGFPGETEKDFQDTLELMESIRFDSLFSFIYSDRPFTRAAQFGDKVDSATKSRRLSQLQELQARITLEKNRAEVGAVREVLVEGESKASNGQFTGRTPQNRVVNFVGSRQWIGRLIPVRIVDAYSHSLKGEAVSRGGEGFFQGGD